jgi:hypothetical protein
MMVFTKAEPYLSDHRFARRGSWPIRIDWKNDIKAVESRGRESDKNRIARGYQTIDDKFNCST